VKEKLRALLLQSLEAKNPSHGSLIKGSLIKGFILPQMTLPDLGRFLLLIHENQLHRYIPLLILPDVLLSPENEKRESIPNWKFRLLCGHRSLDCMFLCNECIENANQDDDLNQPLNFRTSTSLLCSSCKNYPAFAREKGIPQL
jgi:hypothetical protein